jgi:L-methionine (R)-S-oxide reductase
MSAISDVKNPAFNYQGISNYLEKKSPDEKLLQLAEMTAKILGADNCSIMLFGNTESENSHMQVCASYGLLPAVAYKEMIGKGEGIAGHVVATGQSLLIKDIKKSEFASQAQRVND